MNRLIFTELFVVHLLGLIIILGLCNGKLNEDIREGSVENMGRVESSASHAGRASTARHELSRASKIFHYFSLIKFPNEGCSTPSGDGVCTTSVDCKRKKGKSLGTCAQGFGCCCSYTKQCSVDESEFIIQENRTTIINPTNSHQASCRFVLPKLRDICQIRLDFVRFETANPEASGVCNNESLTISGSSTLRNDLIVCGQLTGQHMYLTYGSSEKITLTFQSKLNVNELAAYEIKINHISCNSRRRVPQHCLQSFKSNDGRVQSFNFENQQSNNQYYSICVDPVVGSRFINWKPCSAKSFLISGSPEKDEENDALQQNMPLDCENDFVQAYGDNKQCGNNFREVKNLPAPFLLLVNFDEYEGASQPKPFQAPAEDFFSCDSMSRENFLSCNWTLDDKCICNVTAVLSGDILNTGFCLEYSTTT